MAGGILLLTAMTVFLPLQLVVPLHGIVQLISNFSRTMLLVKHVNRKVLLYFTMGLPFGVFFAILVIKELSKNIPHTLIALVILYAVFKPKKMPELKIPFPYFIGVGAIAGFLGPLVGAVGPFIAPFMLRSDFNKKEMVSTKSSLQLLTHIIKIPTFLFLGFNYAEYTKMIVILSLCAIAGTFIGVKILGKIEEKLFKHVFKVLMFFVAVRLLYKLYF